MADFVLIDGDQVIFMPAFGAAIVVVQPGQTKGSGPSTMGGKKVCVEGDEQQVSVPGCMYSAPPFVTPGTGTLKIAALAPDQKAQHTQSGGKKVLLKGGQFTAKFEVQSPAMNPVPPSPVPDPVPQYSGQGLFVTNNTKYSAT